LPDPRQRDERARGGEGLEPQPALAVGPLAEALGVLLVETELVEQVVGLLDVEGSPLLPRVRPGAVRRAFVRRDVARLADAEPEGLVELVTVDTERQRVPEVLTLDQLGDLWISLVALVDLERGVRAIDCRVEMNRVLALVLVLE